MSVRRTSKPCSEITKAVQKNIEDTKDNVDSLKEQDEAIAVK